MGRIKRLLLTALVLAAMLLTLVGCTSVSALIKSNVSGLPFWYYSPDFNIGANNTAIVGSGTAATERQAELLAYSDVLAKLSSMLGYELGQEAYRELSVLGTISQFNLFIKDSHVQPQGSQVTVYIHVVMDRELLDDATSDETKRRTGLINQIEALVLEGDEYIKSGQEIRAIENYMEAMALGYGLDYIDPEYSFDELYPVIMELLNSISMSVVSARPSTARCTVAITRRGTFVSSDVASAEVVSSYMAIDSRGQLYQDDFVYVTDSDGQFVFNPINDSIVRSGEVVFSFNLDDEFAMLEGIETEKVSALKALVDSKSVRFAYNKVYSLGSIAVAAIEYNRLGVITGNHDIADYLTANLVSNSADATAFYPELDDDEDVLYEFQHTDRTESVLMVVRIGHVDTVESRTGTYAGSAEGIVTLFDCKTSKILYKSDVLTATVFSESAEEAIAAAFRKIADIAYTMIKSVYV